MRPVSEEEKFTCSELAFLVVLYFRAAINTSEGYPSDLIVDVAMTTSLVTDCLHATMVSSELNSIVLIAPLTCTLYIFVIK